MEVGIPPSTVVTTQMFEMYMDRNGLHEIAFSDQCDERIAYALQADLAQAEADGTLKELASTYVASSDGLRMGIGSPGPRVLNFAPLLNLEDIPFNELVKELISL
jgi:hypothetical protein